jgi:hypothetical protein
VSGAGNASASGAAFPSDAVRSGRRHRDGRSQTPRALSYGILLLLLAVALASIAQLSAEWRIASAQAALDDQTLRLARGDIRAAPDVLATSSTRPVRQRMLDALYLARESGYARSPAERRQLLDRASTMAADATSRRPIWGEAWTVRAYIDALRDGPSAPSTVSDLARSYAARPYLAGSAPWRVRVGFAAWRRLSPATQHQLLNEALWLARSDFDATDTVFDLARATPAYQAFALGWRTLRQGDADIQQAHAQPGR